MSFGRAASRGGGARSVDTTAPCPCGSGDPFGSCCGPVLRGEPAPTAERLMRSRYTAFFVGDADHLIASWHPRTRPDDLSIDPQLRWTGLSVDAVEKGGVNDTEGVVEFTAAWEDRSGGDVERGHPPRAQPLRAQERTMVVRRRGRRLTALAPEFGRTVEGWLILLLTPSPPVRNRSGTTRVRRASKRCRVA